MASDISLKSLMVGKEGFYPDSGSQGIPESYLPKYFERKPNGWQITGRHQEAHPVRLPQPEERFRASEHGYRVLPQRPHLLRRGGAEGGGGAFLRNHGPEVVSVHRPQRVPVRHEHPVRVR
ncbi:MAG: hypothetical protein MZV70_69325 [Desulfobacterales bacterium]|nr:hypothetical protein [Desulfobacterales bacterium]